LALAKLSCYQNVLSNCYVPAVVLFYDIKFGLLALSGYTVERCPECLTTLGLNLMTTCI